MAGIRRTAVVGTVMACAVGLAPAALAPAAFAQGGGGGGVTKTGSCSANSNWKLSAKPDDGRIEVEFQVDSNVNGQTWRVRLLDNGTAFFTGTRMTTAPSGSFTVRTTTANRAGTDHIVAKAVNRATGETCRGSVAL